jgi:hypothetical protein
LITKIEIDLRDSSSSIILHGQVLVLDVVDLDIGLVAHINSGSYRGEIETHRKRKTTFKHGIDAQTRMMI